MRRSQRAMVTGSGWRRAAAALMVLALLPSLSGCIAAAVAIPVAAAAGMIGTSVRVRAATPVPERRGGESADGRAALASAGRLPPGVTLTQLTELPAPPIAGTAADPWMPFVTYALRRAGDKQPTESALLAPNALIALAPRRLPCPQREPAVIVDLDDGATAFAPGSAGLPSPGLAEGLVRLREAGVVVLWVSQAHANQVREVADALVFSGLDPSGRDPLLLLRNDEDRKQTLRQQANLDVCVLAVAGDRRGDFDELFDYLRDPEAAAGLEVMMGSGWFIAPAPLGAAPAQ